MTKPIILKEYESKEVTLTAAGQRVLALVGGNRLTVAVGSRPGTCRVTATQYVGTIVTPECNLLIQPKVSLENLFALLGVGLPATAWQSEQFAFGGSRDLLRELSQFFARSVQHATSAGLLHAYRTENERLVGVRGRIDLATQIRHPGDASRIACRFDEYTVDVIENRVLKAACRRLLQVAGVQFEVRRVLRQALATFEDVTDGPVRPEAIDWIVFTRLNRHYEPALRLAQLVLRNLSLLDQAGVHGASAFLVDMNDLFQRFVTDRLSKALRGRLEVVPEPGVRLGTKGRIPMYPDLLFRRTGADVFTGDLKYKLAEDGRGRSADYYQLLAYLIALNLPRGVLIYCQTTGEAPSRRVPVVNGGPELLTYPLDMTGTRQQLETAIGDLATWINHESSGPNNVVAVGLTGASGA